MLEGKNFEKENKVCIFFFTFSEEKILFQLDAIYILVKY